jgi:hypothetical protein
MPAVKFWGASTARTQPVPATDAYDGAQANAARSRSQQCKGFVDLLPFVFMIRTLKKTLSRN